MVSPPRIRRARGLVCHPHPGLLRRLARLQPGGGPRHADDHRLLRRDAAGAAVDRPSGHAVFAGCRGSARTGGAGQRAGRAGPGCAPMPALPQRARPAPAAGGRPLPGGGASLVPALLSPQWESLSARFLPGP